MQLTRTTKGATGGSVSVRSRGRLRQTHTNCLCRTSIVDSCMLQSRGSKYTFNLSYILFLIFDAYYCSVSCYFSFFFLHLVFAASQNLPPYVTSQFGEWLNRQWVLQTCVCSHDCPLSGTYALCAICRPIQRVSYMKYRITVNFGNNFEIFFRCAHRS
jgi:hypothetical protein